MSILSIGLLIAFIAVFIWIKWEEKHKWETVDEASGAKSKELQKRFGLLRRNGVRCQLKNYTPSSIRMMGSQGGQMSNQLTIMLQVHKKDIEQAHKLLADFNKANAPNN